MAHVTAAAVLGAYFGSSTPAAARDSETEKFPDDWARIEEAVARLDRHDFAGALRVVEPIEDKSAAAGHARLVERRVREIAVPQLESTTTYSYDTQPFDAWSHKVAGSLWALPSLRLLLVGEGHLFPNAAITTPEHAQAATVASTYRPAAAHLDLTTSASIRHWEDGSVQPTGRIEAEGRWLEPVRLNGGVARNEVLGVEDAITQHVWVQWAFAALRIPDFHGFTGELRYERRLYSDENAGTVASAWGLAPLVRQKFSFSLGYAAAYVDASELRWVFEQQRYTPYATPIELTRHGPISAASLKLGAVTWRVAGEASPFASDLDPSAAYWGVRSRRKWTYADTKSSIDIDFPTMKLSVAHHYNHQIYYDSHETFIRLTVPLR